MATHTGECEIWGGSRSDSWLLKWDLNLGSGIKRALDAWPYIDFMADQDGCLFTVTVHRKSGEELELVGDSLVKGQGSPKSSPKSSPKTENQILTLISEDSSITTEQLGFVHIEAGCIEADQ